MPNKFYSLTGGERIIYTKPGKISDILKDIKKNYPILAGKIINDECELKAGIIFFRNEENKKCFIDKNEKILAGQKIMLVIAPSGG